jgi:type I restriction enzyme M protein
VKEKTVHAWADLASIPEEFVDRDWIFRGVEDSEYELIPSIGRPENWRRLSDGTSAEYSAALEREAFECFRREASPHIAIKPEADLEWLSIAQHHGLATRFLDWTESPLVAAYFAVASGSFARGSRRERKDAAIYGIPRPARIEDEKDSLESLNKKLGQTVHRYDPQHIFTRITVQRALFTYHTHPEKSYEPPGLLKWIIPGRECFRIKMILDKCGFNEASLFPDLVGIARYTTWRRLKWGQ